MEKLQISPSFLNFTNWMAPQKHPPRRHSQNEESKKEIKQFSMYKSVP